MKKLFILLFAATAFLSCSKDSKTNSAFTVDVTVSNIAGTYKITAATASIGGLSSDVYNNASVFPACSKDDVYQFNADLTFTITDAGVVCSPSNTTSGTYTVNTTAKTITINGQTGTIVGLTSTTITVMQPNFRSTGFDVTLTYTRQ